MGRFSSLNYQMIHRDGKDGLLIEGEEKSYAPPILQIGAVIDGFQYNNVRFAIGREAHLPGPRRIPLRVAHRHHPRSHLRGRFRVLSPLHAEEPLVRCAQILREQQFAGPVLAKQAHCGVRAPSSRRGIGSRV